MSECKAIIKRTVFAITVLLTTSVLMMDSTAAEPHQIRTIRLVNSTYVFFEDIASFYGMRFKRDDKTLSLTSRYSELTFTMERRNAVMNDVVINLLFAPSEWKGNEVMSLQDFKLVLEPILRRKALPQDEIHRIVIDAGHGGKDTGARGSKHDEKDITLAIAFRLGRLLEARGFQVMMTRVADDTRSLSHRTTFATRSHADLFISLHINAAGNSRVSGIETFILTPENCPSTYDTSRRKSSSVGNAFDAENMLLAYEIQKRLTILAGSDDRGVKHANFKVLRETPCASALVELGFISNKPEEARMANPRYQHKLASGIALGIMEFAAALKK